MAKPQARFMITQRVAWRDVTTPKGALKWQWGTVAPPLVWDTGLHASFVVTVLVAVVLAILTTRSYRLVRALRLRCAPVRLKPDTTYN